jgi:hypothetical protein
MDLRTLAGDGFPLGGLYRTRFGLSDFSINQADSLTTSLPWKLIVSLGALSRIMSIAALTIWSVGCS